MRLAVLSDTHFESDRQARVGARRAGIADLLLLRAVHRLNRFVKPDLTVVLGDVVNDGGAADADAQYQLLRGTLDRLRMPWLALPGNHDGPAERFFRHFPAPSPTLDVGGVRFISFMDPEEPGYNARRLAPELARMEACRGDGWKGPVVMLQHVPVFPPGLHPCPYNYANSTAVLAGMDRAGITAAVAGHYHEGFGPLRQDGAAFVAAPALCEAPFAYLILEIDAEGVRAERQSLAMQADLGLVDVHLHTHLAYCNENMDIGLATQLAGDFGLAGLRFTEHSGHLYFGREDYGPPCFTGGIAAARPGDNRMGAYTTALAAYAVPPEHRGVEVDADYTGDAIVRPEDLGALPFHVGAVHGLRCLASKTVSDDVAAQGFLAVMERFLGHRFAVLAHPFRVFRRAGRPTPAGLVEPIVRLLQQSGTAAEINFHTNDPDPVFVRRCIEAGVPLAFGSDAHNLYEVGEFFPHLELLRRAGYDGDPRDVLLRL